MIKNKKEAFSKVKSLGSVLISLGLHENLQRKKYALDLDLKIEEVFLKNSYDFISQLILNIDVWDSANESDRELVAQMLVWQCVNYICQTHNLDIKIGSKKMLSDIKSRGFVDFWIYKRLKIDSRGIRKSLDKIFVVFEVKQELMDKGAGQIIMELRAIYQTTKCKTYGAVTNFHIWEFFFV